MSKDKEIDHLSEHHDQLPRLPQLANTVIHANLNHEIERLKNAPAWEQGAGRSSETLVKYDALRIVLVVMKEQSQMNQHHADGPISVHVIQGRLRLHLPEGQSVELEPGNMIAMEAGLKHDVEALVESAFLLTIAWTLGESSKNG